MRSPIEVASGHGCGRVEWTADTGSTGAQTLGSKLKVPPLPSKIFYRIEGDGSGLQLPSDPAPRPPPVRRTRACLR